MGGDAHGIGKLKGCCHGQSCLLCWCSLLKAHIAKGCSWPRIALVHSVVVLKTAVPQDNVEGSSFLMSGVAEESYPGPESQRCHL